MTHSNVDPGEVGKFDALAARWWDPGGEFRTLHAINPVRLSYIGERTPLAGSRVLDVGCGGGLLCEAMARAGAAVTGIDASQMAVTVAGLHLTQSGLPIDYAVATAEEYAAGHAGSFDTVTCMELLEHVPDAAALVEGCARLVRPGGSVFFSTLNRSPRAYLLAVLGAEYALGLLPKGTHDYRRFVRPSELARWARAAGLELIDMAGMAYNPLTHRAALTDSVTVNYLARFRKPQ